MKRGFKSFLLVILMFTLTLGISGCFWNENVKTFSKHGVSITLTDDFEEENNFKADYLLVSYDVVAAFYQVEFIELTDEYSSETPLKEFAKSYAENRTSKTDTTTTTRENKGYEYLELEEEIDGDDFYHYISIYKSKDSFWVLQLTCYKEKKSTYKKKFPKWADTVVFDADIEESTPEESV